MKIPFVAVWLLVFISTSPSSGQDIAVPEIDGFEGHVGGCNKGMIESSVGHTIDACAAACRTTWRCYAFVIAANVKSTTGASCSLLYQSCDETTVTDDTSLLTYVNKDPMRRIDFPGNDTLCSAHGAQCVAPNCCPYMYEAEDICSGYPARRCCLHPPDCDWKAKEQALSYWMQGSYALPRSAFGCPDTNSTPWITTKAELVLTASQTNNSRSKVSRMPGSLSGPLTVLSTCLQTESTKPQSLQAKQAAWPRGSYCVYKAQDDVCPQGLSEGLILVDRSDLQLARYTLMEPELRAPNGSFMLGFCCRRDGNTIDTIRLPTPSPFSLLKADSECQNVLYMMASSDYIQLDFGSKSSVRSFGQVPFNSTVRRSTVRLEFCHYRPYETCHFEADNGRTYHGFVNMTRSGTCRQFRDTSGWWNTEDYPELMGVVVKNHCLGVRTLNPKPFCYPPKYEEIQACAIPYCTDFRQLELVSKRGVMLPVRQMVGPLNDAILPIDGDSNTCSKQTGYKPWWQIDLQRAETVIGLTTKDNLGRICSFSSLDISVSMDPDDFIEQTGLMCVKDYWTYGALLQIKCVRPVVGQYLTIRQGTRTLDDTEERIRCLLLCEVEVFTMENMCGSTFNHLDLDPVSQVKVSSSKESSGVEHVTLFSTGAWCAADNSPFLQVDLLVTRTITGFWTQGSPDTRSPSMVTNFQLAFGLQLNEMLIFEENNVPKVFNMGTEPQKPRRHDLSISIQARYLRFTFTKWDHAPCFRFRIIGCQFRQKNLVSGNSWLPGEGAVLQDMRRETCLTLTKSRWTVTLSSQVSVIDIILRLGERYIFNVEVWVTASVIASETDDSQWTLCARQEVTSAIMGMRCSGEPVGNRVMFVMKGNGDVSVCEVEVYGATLETPRQSLMVNPIKTWSKLEVTCPVDHVAQIVAVKRDLELYNLEETQRRAYTNMSEKVVITAGLWCPGQTRECAVWPYSMAGPPTNVLLGCVSVVTPDPLCQTIVTTVGDILLTDDYLRMYGTSRVCSWIINSPPGKFAKLSVIGFKIQDQEESFMDGDHLVDVGTCRDMLSIGYLTTGDNEPEMMEVQGEQTFISPEGGIVLRLATCFRYQYVKPSVKLETNLEFIDCFGCGIRSECSDREICDKKCGFLQSPGFPLDYAPNRKCSWLIRVAGDAYIRLRFLQFDVFEEQSMECNGDVVEFFEFDFSGEKETRLGRYCNTYLPPETIETGWNLLRLDFYTNQQDARMGFSARYESASHKFNENVVWSDNSPECREGWIFYEKTCIKVFKQEEALTWLQAESECRRQGANLASINNEEENIFLNFLLISRYNVTDVYIGACCSRVVYAGNACCTMVIRGIGCCRERVNVYGNLQSLTDRDQEGVFRWADGLPLTYTNWRQHEPDGGAIEDCSVVSLAGVRLQPSWKDISCAATIYSAFVCSYSTNTNSKRDLAPVLVQPDETVSCEGSQMFQCSSGECVHQVLMCDGRLDCSNGTDEEGCGVMCGITSFKCGDGSCISLTFTCDGQEHCLDGSDEASCDYPPCKTGEFRCDNGECVPWEARCDLMIDCADGSDELDCTWCSENRTFQCYEGTCVGRARVCDNYYDCPGLLREDEAAAACMGSFPQTCLDWWKRGYVETGRYDVQIPGNDLMSVTCDMTSVPGEVVTIIHHNHEAPNATFHGFEAPASYRKNITYFASWDSIYTIRSMSDRCEQFLETICRNAETFAKSWFVGADDLKHWYHDDVENDGCNCRLRKVCRERPENKRCYCASPLPDVTHVDRGYFTQTSVIPVRQLTMEDTGNVRETAFYTLGPLRCYQKFEGVALMRCKSGQSYTTEEHCVYREDELGVPQGCRDATNLEDCGTFQCPENFFKCPNGFCLSASNVCDGKRHCKNGEDELDCGSYMCPGMMRCRGETNCAPMNQICDGQRQCPLGDDEWFCDITCPDQCSCTGLTYLCTYAQLRDLPPAISDKARKIDLSDNMVDVTRLQKPLNTKTTLIELLLARNDLLVIPPLFFSNLTNLRHLDLSGNAISIIYANTFYGLQRLAILNLKSNPLTYIEPNAFKGLISLPKLDISEMALNNITYGVFSGLTNLEILDMSRNTINKLEGNIFEDLDNIKHIKMYGNRISEFVKDDFAGLHTLATMHSDDFMFCCFVNIKDKNCLPPKDILSSCEDLMENDILRSFLWVLGCMAFVGNAFVFLYRSASADRDRVPSMLIRNLSVADLLMGLYMLAIAAVDLNFRGVYIENAQTWKKSTMCQVLGCLSTIASEASVFTLGFITVDRLINILFPLSTWKFTPKSARYVLAGLWLAVFIIAAIPLVPGSYFQGVFYSRSGVCVSLYITSEQTPGWEYSFFIFHGLNLCVFIFIFFAYGYMYQIIKRAGAMGAGEQKKREMAAARKMTLIVVTDFCCWVPINVMGFLALSGMQIPGVMYAWTVVFIMPVNSALNPVLYTISSITFPWQKTSAKTDMSTSLHTERTRVIVGLNEKDAPFNTLDSWMKSPEVSSLPAVVNVIRQMAQLLRNLHGDGLYLGQLDAQSVLIEQKQVGSGVSFSGYPQMASLNPEGQAVDLEVFGKVVSRLMRASAAARKER